MLIDRHCRLDYPAFARDHDGVIARAHAAGVGRMVTISGPVCAFATVKEIIEGHKSVFGTIGTHPHYAGRSAM